MADPSPWSLTSFGCPDCSGVLTVKEEGNLGLLVFRCTVGHTFSSESLIAAKEEQLENALWTVVELFQEIDHLCGELASRAKDGGPNAQSAAYTRRAGRARDLAERVRQIIAADGPAPLQGPG